MDNPQVSPPTGLLPAWLKDRLLGPHIRDPLCIPAWQERVEIRLCAWLPLLGGKLAGMKSSAAAVTIGSWVLVAPGIPLSRRLVRHELEHVFQWRADLFFPLRYALAQLRHGYDQNPYEIAARQAEKLVD